MLILVFTLVIVVCNAIDIQILNNKTINAFNPKKTNFLQPKNINAFENKGYLKAGSAIYLGSDGCSGTTDMTVTSCGDTDGDGYNDQQYYIYSCRSSCDRGYEERYFKCNNGNPVISSSETTGSIQFCAKVETAYIPSGTTIFYYEIGICYQNTNGDGSVLVWKKDSNHVLYYIFDDNDCSGTASINTYEATFTEPYKKHKIVYSDDNYCNDPNGCGRLTDYQVSGSSINECVQFEHGSGKFICGKGYSENSGSCEQQCLVEIDHCVSCSTNDYSKCSLCESPYKVNSNGQCELDGSITFDTYGDDDGCVSGSGTSIETCDNKNTKVFTCSGSCANGYSKKSITPCGTTRYYCEKIPCSVSNCEYCSSNNYCEQCNYGFISDGYGGCEKEDNDDNSEKSSSNQKCQIENCKECLDYDEYYCITCENGYYRSHNDLTQCIREPQDDGSGKTYICSHCLGNTITMGRCTGNERYIKEGSDFYVCKYEDDMCNEAYECSIFDISSCELEEECNTAVSVVVMLISFILMMIF